MEYRGCRPVGTAMPVAKPARDSASPGTAIEQKISSRFEPVPEPANSSSSSLAYLLDQARAAQAQLSAQPLPITNQSRDFILKLLGG